MKKSNRAVAYIFALLLLATLTTTQILSASYARYITATDPVGDSARVAVYEVTATGANSTMANTPDSDKTSVNLDAAGNQNISGGTIAGKTVSAAQVYSVVNNSEVAVSYTVVVTLTNALPDGTSMKLTDTGSNEILPDVNGNTYTFTSNTFVMEAGAGQAGAHAITLTFTTDNTGDSAVSELSGIAVTVEVNAEQIDN